MKMITLYHANILPARAAFHLVRATLSTSRPKALHNHDFYELIWVQNGRVRHYLPDGHHDLTEGDIVFIRPGDSHALQGKGEEPLIVSLTLHPDLVDAIGARHGLTGFFWSDAPAPDQYHRNIRKLADLNHAALRLEQAPPTGLEAEAFLLPLLADLAVPSPDMAEDAPGWLRDACLAAREPAVFRDGAAGFVRVTGRAHPHVSRTMRRFLGQSPSDYVNAIRMDYAARRLTGTPDPLPEIAADCGIPNLSHFHKLFRAQHGMTPHKFRRAHQRDVVQPTA